MALLSRSAYLKFSFYFTLYFLLNHLLYAPLVIANESPHALTIVNKAQEAKENSPLSLVIKEIEAGIQLSLHLVIPQKVTMNPGGPDVKPGGEITCSVNENMLLHDFFEGALLDKEYVVPFHKVDNGQHTLHCEVLATTGGLFQSQATITFDTTPSLIINPPDKDRGLFDPIINYFIFGSQNDQAGTLTVYVDERVHEIIPIESMSTVQSKLLSELLSIPLPLGTLSPGTHLLRINAQGFNRWVTSRLLPFQVQNLPTITVEQDASGNFIQLNYTLKFPGENSYGSISLYYENGVILEQRSKESKIVISRSEIKEALKKYYHKSIPEEISLVVAAYAPNGEQVWQEVLYR